LTCGVLVRSLGGAIALVTLGGALVGIDGLGLIGTSNSEAGCLARHIARIALGHALELGAERGRRSCGGAGDGARLGEGTSGEKNEGSGVLHVGDGGFDNLMSDGT